ncbi:hypothetical protein B1690_02910 [Geobacillus sp. 46C-IIa]|uniref:DUF1850 domain-containing protein n=1 Tax=Geobacillus sp. 46C-IIa TaxID=1963025 RepID=UPI0009BF2DE7|nr:DUF1850 domain-containing protein [Geobacillus sp. 46C-IIa]OQP07497.1 hypothetical protein B1690_02910 [Geobacillus sp. 46C-IIa]QNU28337.1 DUF1850 domain-containing protein [Geobacillus sp. 46C-IIa]
MRKRVVAISVLLAAAAVFFLPFRQVVAFEKEGRVAAYIPISQGDTFAIRYTHSIHRSDVEETYQVMADGTIEQIALTYEDTAVGMPANAAPGETFTFRNGKYYITGMERKFPSILLSIGRVVANHRVVYKGKTVALKTVIPPGSIVRIKVARLSLVQCWKGVNLFG